MVGTSEGVPQEQDGLQIPAQDLLNFAVSNSPVIFYVAAIGGEQPLKFISANVEAITGHKQAHFLRHAGARRGLLHPDDLPAFRDTVNTLKSRQHDDETVSHEYRFRHADGSYLWFRDELRLNTSGSDGEPRVIGCMINITAERESRNALLESEKRFQFIVEGYPLPVVVVDIESSEIIYESPAAAELFGRDWTSADKPRAWEHYEDYARGREFVNQLREFGEVSDFEFPTRRADGTLLHTAATSRLYTLNGREVSITSITDMSESKMREDELRQARETLEDAIESLSEGFALYDSEDRLVMCNGQYKAFNPIAADLYVPGRRRIDILSEAVSRGQFPSAVGREEEWLEGRRSESREIVNDTYRTADDRWFDRSHRPTRQGGRVVTIRDITERCRMEQALRDSEAMVRRVLEGCPLPVQMTRLDGVRIYESPASSALFGSQIASGSSNIHRYADPADRDYYVNELLRVGKVDNHECLRKRADGTEFWAAVSGRLIEYKGEQVIVSCTIDLTERRKQEAALRDARQTLEDAIEALSEGFVLWDANENFVMCNQRYREFNTVTNDMLVKGVSRNEFVQAGIDRGQYSQIRRDGESYRPSGGESDLEKVVGRAWEIQQSDGRWFLGSVQKTRQGGTVGIRVDITERKNMEESLQESEALVRRVLEGCPLPIQMTRMTGERIYESPASSELFGSSVGFGQSVLHRYVNRQDFDLFIRKLEETGRVDEHEFQRKRTDGTVFWAAHSGRLIEYQGEQVVVSCTIDLTETKQREAELRESEELVRRVLEACPVSLSMSRVETGEYIYFSPANAALLGIAETSEPVFSANTYVDSADREKYISLLSRDGRVDELEIERRRADGTTFWASMSSRIIEYKGEDVIVSSLFDLTERRAVEDEMARQREILHQSEKLSAFGELLAGVSHELNNPLSVLLGQAILLKDSSSDDGIKARAEKLYAAADRCARIVKTFLAMARQRPVEVQSLCVNEIVEDALEVTAYSLRSSDIVVLPRLAKDLPNVLIDPDQLRQVITNLVINAEHALLDISSQRQLKIRTSYSLRSNEVVIKIKDNGPGISEDIRRRIFEPLFTTKDVGVGTGIGLALCHRIIEAHGGSIVLESAPDEGAAFAIRLPADSRSPIRAEPLAVSSDGSARFEILVIDDEADVGSVMCDLLIADGHNATAAVSGEEALRLLRERSFDLIFCDIRMPHIGGPEFYKALVEEWPEMVSRLAFVTGDYLSKRATAFLDESGCPYIEKPATPTEIRNVIGMLGNLSQRENREPRASTVGVKERE